MQNTAQNQLQERVGKQNEQRKQQQIKETQKQIDTLRDYAISNGLMLALDYLYNTDEDNE